MKLILSILIGALAFPATSNIPGLGGGGTTSTVKLSTCNSYGSTATATVRCTTTNLDSGSDITYTDSATNGATMTINTEGVYTAICCVGRSGGTVASSGISINYTGTGGATDITYAQGRRAAASGPSEYYICSATTTNFAVNDAVRCMMSGDSLLTGDEGSFEITGPLK